jgi:hypothetical protein
MLTCTALRSANLYWNSNTIRVIHGMSASKETPFKRFCWPLLPLGESIVAQRHVAAQS